MFREPGAALTLQGVGHYRSRNQDSQIVESPKYRRNHRYGGREE